MDSIWSTSKIEERNKNGDLLCHAFGCRKHVKLIICFGGVFCKKTQRRIRKN